MQHFYLAVNRRHRSRIRNRKKINTVRKFSLRAHREIYSWWEDVSGIGWRIFSPWEMAKPISYIHYKSSWSYWLTCYRTKLADKSRCMVRFVCLLDFSPFPLKFQQLIKNRYKRSSAECQTKPSETIHASRLSHLHPTGELLSREGLTGL